MWHHVWSGNHLPALWHLPHCLPIYRPAVLPELSSQYEEHSKEEECKACLQLLWRTLAMTVWSRGRAGRGAKYLSVCLFQASSPFCQKMGPLFTIFGSPCDWGTVIGCKSYVNYFEECLKDTTSTMQEKEESHRILPSPAATDRNRQWQVFARLLRQ